MKNTCTIDELVRRAVRDKCWSVQHIAYIGNTLYLGDHEVPEELEDEILQRLQIDAVVKAAYGE